eukprot:scaffold254772_cov32-Tisochrysis_lutea.AAC.4
MVEVAEYTQLAQDALRFRRLAECVADLLYRHFLCWVAPAVSISSSPHLSVCSSGRMSIHIGENDMNAERAKRKGEAG